MDSDREVGSAGIMAFRSRSPLPSVYPSEIPLIRSQGGRRTAVSGPMTILSEAGAELLTTGYVGFCTLDGWQDAALALTGATPQAPQVACVMAPLPRGFPGGNRGAITTVAASAAGRACAVARRGGAFQCVSGESPDGRPPASGDLADAPAPSTFAHGAAARAAPTPGSSG
jgi:hypothetical protein